MEEKEEASPEYLKGFNEGYLISKHEPKLAAQLSTAEGTTERLQGMKDGHSRFELEKETLEKSPLGKENHGRERSPDKDKGRGHEPNR